MSGSISDEGLLRKLLQLMNSQVPSKRWRLSELLSESEPHYVARDGSEYSFNKEELGFIRKNLEELGLDDVKLPILLIADPSHEQSVWRVEGEAECALLSHILGRDLGESKDRIFLYAPHLTALRSKLPTTTICMFMP